MFSPFAIQKVNTLIYRFNKLSMKNFAEFLKSKYAEVYRDVEIHHTLENIYQMEKCIYVVSQMGSHIGKKRKLKE